MYRASLAFLFFVLTASAMASPATSTDPSFEGVIARTADESTPRWPERATAPDGAPNVVVILLDDIGFGNTGTFGGLVDTPVLDRIAGQGLRYNNFNVTAMCSPTRASLLSGRNHHRVGFATISEGANGYPGYNSYWNRSTATIAEGLRRSGYRTAAIGKWHNTPEWEISQAGPFDRWPTGLGFEYFYGFMGAEDNHWQPERLYRGTTPILSPENGKADYHLTQDLTDEAIAWLLEHRSIAAEKPYFLYFATGAVHSPHHVPQTWIDRQKGKFDKGWDELRKDIFAQQKRLGVIPLDTVLTPRPPQIPAWDSLSDDQQRLFARRMEVFAAFIAHTDAEIGRLLETVEQDENTLIFYVVGDNGAVGQPPRNYGGNVTVAENLARIDDLGGPLVPFNQSQGGWGWMGNTPFPYWKTVGSHLGGLRAPLIVSWPGQMKDEDHLRQQFAHVTDIVPTIYEVTGIEPPEAINGINQAPLDGFSLVPTFTDRNAASRHITQYFELGGNRAIYHDGWMASALNAFMSSKGRKDEWELYDLNSDFSQSRDLADAYPDKLQELKAIFDREAWANYVYPIGGEAWFPENKPFAANKRKRFDFYQGEAKIASAQLPNFNLSHTLEAEIVVADDHASGLLASYGYRNRGFAWYMRDGKLIYENLEGVRGDVLNGTITIGPGRHVVRYQFTCDSCQGPGRQRKPISGVARLFIDDQLAAEKRLENVNLINGGESIPLYLGRARGPLVGEGYAPPFPFSGAIERLTIILQ